MLLLILVLIYSGFMSWACHGAAATRGRDPTAWAILGFFFGLFALLVVFLMGDTRGMAARADEKRGLDLGDLRKCPHCAETVKAAATKCRYCGSELFPITA